MFEKIKNELARIKSGEEKDFRFAEFEIFSLEKNVSTYIKYQDSYVKKLEETIKNIRMALKQL